jgi:hypothetical protein
MCGFQPLLHRHEPQHSTVQYCNTRGSLSLLRLVLTVCATACRAGDGDGRRAGGGVRRTRRAVRQAGRVFGPPD